MWRKWKPDLIAYAVLLLVWLLFLLPHIPRVRSADPYADPIVPGVLDYPAACRQIDSGRVVVLAVGVPAPKAIPGCLIARTAKLPETEPGLYVCFRADRNRFARLTRPPSADAVGELLDIYRVIRPVELARSARPTLSVPSFPTDPDCPPGQT